MELGLSSGHEAFREEIRAFAGQHRRAPGERWSTTDAAAFRLVATERGYLYRSVPRRYGGSEQTPDSVKAQLIEREFRAAGLPYELRTMGTQMVVPNLLDHGAEWQRARFIRDTIEGRIIWCQGYSEPDAGSDLASLRTRAELIGDAWVINGQKVWTSYADKADYMFALVRTEPDKAGRDGISYLLIDMKQPGITVRPLRQINGNSEFNEVFFTDARTPADWMVGDRGKGWDVSRSLLKHERNRLGGAERTSGLFESLLKLAKRTERAGAPAIASPAIRERLVHLLARAEINRLSAMIQLSREIEGREEGILQLYNKLFTSDYSADVARLALELAGSDCLIEPALSGKRGNEKWMDQYMNSLSASIAGGASNIQRNIIAERGLGMPRDQGDPAGRQG